MTNNLRRDADLRQMLIDKRTGLRDDVDRRIRGARTDRPREVGDYFERSDADIQEDIELTLLQATAETLRRIDEALVRLDHGQYGSCLQCEGEIASVRLHALPFAVRCQRCEEKREQDGHARQVGARRRSMSLFQDATR